MVDQKVKYMIRIHNTDLNGEKSIGSALTKVKGIGMMFANAICVSTKIKPNQKVGLLTDVEVKKLNDTIKDPIAFGIPIWMLNRRNDPTEGTDGHLLTSDLDFTKGNDIKHMQKIRCYKGVRHASRLPVRGQRTKSNFRKNKGKAASVFKTKAKPGKK